MNKIIKTAAAFIFAALLACAPLTCRANSDAETAISGESAAEQGEAENELGYVPSDAIAYEGYTLGAAGVAAIAALALAAGATAFFAARKADREGLY